MPGPALAAAAAPAAAGAGKGAATAAGAGKGAATAGAAGAAGAGGGGLSAMMASPWFQLLAPTALGIIAGQNPQSAAGVRAGLGAYDMLSSLNDSESVARAMMGYSEAVSEDVQKEVLGRGMNEAVVSAGLDQPAPLVPGGPFVMGGPAPTTYEGQPLGALKAYEAAAKTLPATGRANPMQAGFMLSGIARGAPSPTPRPAPAPDLYAIKEQFQSMFPGYDFGAEMRDGKITMRATSPDERPPDKEEPKFTEQQLLAAREELAELPGNVEETLTVLGPGGGKRQIRGRGAAATGGGEGAGQGIIQQSVGGGVELLYDPKTRQYIPITPEMRELMRQMWAEKEAAGEFGVVTRNPDGTLSLRR